jgi:hypothetical protein
LRSYLLGLPSLARVLHHARVWVETGAHKGSLLVMKADNLYGHAALAVPAEQVAAAGSPGVWFPQLSSLLGR